MSASRTHLVVGGFPPGASAAHDMDYARLRLLGLLDETPSIATTVSSDFADLESETLVNQRLDDLKDRIMSTWLQEGAGYELVIEPEVFWRLGGPVRQSRGGEQ